MTEQRGAHFVQAVERAFRVLGVFTQQRPELTLTEVAQASGLDRAGARRLLLTLGDLGYVEHDGRQYSLTPKVLEFGYAYLSARSLPQIAEPHLRKLTAELGEMTSVGVLDGDDVRYVAEVSSPKLLSATIPVGSRFPAHATSLGKVLLADVPPERLEARFGSAPLRPVTPFTTTSREALHAQLAQVRKQGYVISDGELEPGLRGVAVPVRGRDGRVCAAVNVSLDVHRSSTEQVAREVVPPLLTTASRIEADLRLQSTTDGAAPRSG